MMTESIRIHLAKINKSKLWLAEQLGWSPSKLYYKMKKDDFCESDAIQIAEVLGCQYVFKLIPNE